MKLSVVEYVTSTGKGPYQEWLRRLRDKTAKAVVIRRVIRIELGDLGDAGAKRMQEKDVERAKNYWKDHQERYGKDTQN